MFNFSGFSGLVFAASFQKSGAGHLINIRPSACRGRTDAEQELLQQKVEAADSFVEPRLDGIPAMRAFLSA